jgi:hypothetical protein
MVTVTCRLVLLLVAALILLTMAVVTMAAVTAGPAFAADPQYDCNYDVATGNQEVTDITPTDLAELISLQSSGEIGNLTCAIA